MKNEYRRTILYAVVWLTGWYMLAIVFWPHQSTISYLGTMKPTAVQYAVALVGTAYFLWKAANIMAAFRAFEFVHRSLKGFAVCVAVLPLAPYSLHDVLFWAHMGILSCALTLAVALCIRIAIIVRRALVYSLLVAQVFGVSMFLYTFKMSHISVLWRMQFVYEWICIGALFLILYMAAHGFRAKATAALPA